MKLMPVEEEYMKNSELKKEDVQNVMDWIAKQPHLPKITELEIILFLHCTFFKLEAAKNVIDTYYTCRTHCPEFFEDRNPVGPLERNMDICTYYTVPKSTPENYRVIYVYLSDKDTSKFNFPQLVKLFTMHVDLLMMTKGTAPGHVILMDLENLTLGHLPKLSLMHIKKSLYYLQEAIQFRLTGIHVINVVPFIDKLMALIRPFMKKELLNMLVFHTEGLHSLYKNVSQESIPEHLGGKAASKKDMGDLMKQNMKDNAEYFKKEATERVDETKRPGMAKNTGDIFGVEGSFKKLDID